MQDLLSIKLNHAQQLQLQQRANAERARSTLQEIDDIMAERQPSLARAALSAAVDVQARSPPMSPRRRPPVMHSPRGLARSEQLAALGGAGQRPLSASPVRATTAAAATSTARPSRIPIANGSSSSFSVRPASIKPKPRPPPVRKQRMAKLESELDSALSQAQKLMDNFMHQLA
jgi:hypothetical protein